MALSIARLVLIVVGSYLAAGVVFAAGFLTVGLGRIDPLGGRSSWGFRLLLAPGVIALWPLLARRWIAGVTHPPEPVDAHRRAAQGSPR